MTEVVSLRSGGLTKASQLSITPVQRVQEMYSVS